MRAPSPASPRTIPVSQPVIGAREYEAVNEALRSGAISGSAGKFVGEFESLFSEFCGSRFGVTTSSGTAALHLALAALDIGPGDDVLVSTLTNMATFFAVHYLGARPIPIDVEPDTCNLDPRLLAAKLTARTKAVLVVHLFGHPVDMDPVMAFAAKNNLKVVEDAAEAHGAEYRGKRVGSFGDAGCFSFYANKIVTTGEGGMVTTSDAELAERIRSLRSLAFGDEHKFMHKEMGYSARMTNLQAALGVAQMSRIDQAIERKRHIADGYRARLSDIADIQLPVEKPYAKSVYWMYHIILKGKLSGRRDRIRSGLAARGVDTRESFVPYNQQRIYVESGQVRGDECPVANEIGLNGFYLPSGPSLVDEDLDYVANAVREVLEADRS